MTNDEKDDPRFEKEALQACCDKAKPASREHVAKINEIIDDSLEVELISIRLHDDLIETLKEIAEREGVGHQTLIRQILTRFAHDHRHK